MKRAIVSMLLISLVALPSLAAEKRAQCVSLEHVRGAWQMQIKCDIGDGSITLADSHGTKTYRGDGVFASWSQEQLGTMYESLVPRETDTTELLQLG